MCARKLSVDDAVTGSTQISRSLYDLLLTNIGQNAFHSVVLELSSKVGRGEIPFRVNQAGNNPCNMRSSLETLNMRKSFMLRGDTLTMDVPDRILVLVVPPIQALITFVPGAKTSTTEP